MRSKLFWLFVLACIIAFAIVSCQSQSTPSYANTDLMPDAFHPHPGIPYEVTEEYANSEDDYYCYVCERAFCDIDYVYEPTTTPEPTPEPVNIPGELDLQRNIVFVANRYNSVLKWGYFYHVSIAEPVIVVTSEVLDTYTDNLLELTDIIEYEMKDKVLALLAEAVLTYTPEAVPYVETIGVNWLSNLVMDHDGVRVLLTPDITGWDFGFIDVLITYEDLDEAFALGVELGLREPPRKPMVALTFDDGPSPYTDLILDLLEAVGGRATFCVLGNRIHHHPDTLVRAVELGSEIVGHSWDHRNMARLNSSSITSQIVDTSAAIEAVIGHAPPPIFRAPYGQINNRVTDTAQSLGYSLLHWSVDPQDWANRDPYDIYEGIMRRVMDGSIILLHDIHPTTADAMKIVIPRLIADGFQLVTASELIAYHYGELEPGEVYLGFRNAPW